MTPHYTDESVTLYAGDCLDVLATLADDSVDAVVTDPPYGLGFMGKTWDSDFIPSDMPMRGNPRLDAVNAGASRQGGRQRASVDYQKRQARDARSYQEWCEMWARECLRVLKPGGHMLAFGGTRTSHRLACAIEDAGFEIRDTIAWLYGSGFPKSLDVSKAIDKRRDWTLVSKLADAIRAARAESGLSLREVGEAVKVASHGTHGEWYHRGGHMFFETGMSLPGRSEWKHLRSVVPIPAEFDAMYEEAERQIIRTRTMTQGGGTSLQLRMGEARQVNADITAPATAAAEQWQGWGTALKPANEPIVVARKSPIGTVAANVLAYGTGALNIDGCRIGGPEDKKHPGTRTYQRFDPGSPSKGTQEVAPYTLGRWPTNVVLDPDAAAELDAQTGPLTSGGGIKAPEGKTHGFADGRTSARHDFDKSYEGDSGGASRFFPTFRYEAKAPQHERPGVDGIQHPTVKPLDLMRWLVRLVTPPGGVVLEPFAGSGTTAEACIVEGFRCIAIEREADYLPLILARITKPIQPDIFGGAA